MRDYLSLKQNGEQNKNLKSEDHFSKTKSSKNSTIFLPLFQQKVNIKKQIGRKRGPWASEGFGEMEGKETEGCTR